MSFLFSLHTNKPEYMAELMDVVRAFSPYALIDESASKVEVLFLTSEVDSVAEMVAILLKYEPDDNNYYEEVLKLELLLPKHAKGSKIKRIAKIALYKFLSEKTGIKMPYGSLTGIRPTKLFYDKIEAGFGVDEVKKCFTDELFVSPQKTDLVAKIVTVQTGIYLKDVACVDIFINIPFCTTRCSYCSFICAEIDKVKKFLSPYCEQLQQEILCAHKIVREGNLKVRAVYVGGGTPTSISDEQLDSILSICNFSASEFTVEAGRPDTITREKLQIMKNRGVTRISINPQSFNEKTLEKIGRNHSVESVEEVYKVAREYGFDINMDLIAMLPDESYDDFCHSLERTLKLLPENITVHTLAIKAGSKLSEENYDNKCFERAVAMTDFALAKLQEGGYVPYYMYRLKNMSGNLDNIGFCRPNKACIYNIDIMEETISIIACGAGGISKRVFGNQNRIERLANPKGLDVYLARSEEIISKKINFFGAK